MVVDAASDWYSNFAIQNGGKNSTYMYFDQANIITAMASFIQHFQ